MMQPVPITFEPTWADEWLVWVTIASFAGSIFLGLVALRNASIANKIVETQKSRDIRETVRESGEKILGNLRKIDKDLDLLLEWSFLKERSKAEGWEELSDLITTAIDLSKTNELSKRLPLSFNRQTRELLATWIIDPQEAKPKIDNFKTLKPADFINQPVEQ